MTNDNIVPLPSPPPPDRPPTWWAAIELNTAKPARFPERLDPTGDPLLDLVNDWTWKKDGFAGARTEEAARTAMFCTRINETVAALENPPLPTTLAGAAAALDLVLAEGVIKGAGVAVVRAVAEALRRGLPVLATTDGAR